MSDSMQNLVARPTERQLAEWALDQDFAQSKSVAPVHGLLRFCCPYWAVEELISFMLILRLHLMALRRISEALGNPLKDVKDKTALDLADLAVAAIRKGQEAEATR